MVWSRRFATSSAFCSSVSSWSRVRPFLLRGDFFWMRIFSVLVTTTLKDEPLTTGTSGSPSRVKASLKDAAKGL